METQYVSEKESVRVRSKQNFGYLMNEDSEKEREKEEDI